MRRGTAFYSRGAAERGDGRRRRRDAVQIEPGDARTRAEAPRAANPEAPPRAAVSRGNRDVFGVAVRRVVAAHGRAPGRDVRPSS